MHARPVHRVLVLAGLLGLVHGDVGVAQQHLGFVAAVPAGGQADARADEHVAPVDAVRVGEFGEDPPGHLCGVRLVGLFEQHRELVAAQARGGVGRAQRRR